MKTEDRLEKIYHCTDCNRMWRSLVEGVNAIQVHKERGQVWYCAHCVQGKYIEGIFVPNVASNGEIVVRRVENYAYEHRGFIKSEEKKND